MSDYESSQRRRDVVVGIFVVLGLTALGWMIFKFGDLPTAVSRMKSFQVYVQFPTAPGVQKDTPVRFCGYQIGRVTSVMAPAYWRTSTRAANTTRPKPSSVSTRTIPTSLRMSKSSS